MGKNIDFRQVSNKAVIYARVSSEQQVQGFSLQGQEEICRRYAEKNKLNVCRIWSGPESAWGKVEREELNDMINYVKKDSDIKHIIFYVEDRMTRNFDDKQLIEKFIREYGIFLHFACTGKVYSCYSNANDRLIMNMNIAIAEDSSNRTSERTSSALLIKAKTGEFPGPAPLGYINTGEGTKRIIAVDLEVAPLIRELFELVASGSYSLKMLVDIMYAKGLRSKKGIKVGAASLHYIIKNTMYYGIFKWVDEEYMGTHKPIITKELYIKANKALISSWRPHLTKHNHPFSNLMVCSHCGCAIVADRAKKKYMYYRCSASKGTHEGRHYFTEREITEKFQEIVDNITVPKDIARWMQKAVDRHILKIGKQKKKNIEDIKQRLGLAKHNLERLYEKALDISSDALNHNEAKYKKEILKYQTIISTASLNTDMIHTKSIDILKFLSNIGYDFKNADFYKKAEFLRKIATRYSVCGNQITPIYREAFSIFSDGKEDKKECLELNGIPQKSSKHQIWLRLLDIMRKENYADVISFYPNIPSVTRLIGINTPNIST